MGRSRSGTNECRRNNERNSRNKRRRSEGSTIEELENEDKGKVVEVEAGKEVEGDTGDEEMEREEVKEDDAEFRQMTATPASVCTRIQQNIPLNLNLVLNSNRKKIQNRSGHGDSPLPFAIPGDITGRKGCDCSICKSVDNKLSPVVGKRIGDDGGGKSSCSICEKRKEMLRMEREKQRQLQKCPFEILAAPAMKGKTSEEIFDEFRELVVPSQNGFFDMMRGIVRTMHGTSVVELQRAKEKEAIELAKKKKQEAEEAKKKKLEEEEAKKRKKAGNAPKDELVGLNSPVNPKVTVVLKQTPCGQIIQPSEPVLPEKIPLTKRLPKETGSDVLGIPEEEILHLQSMDDQHIGEDYRDVNSKENLLHSNLFGQLIGFRMTTPAPHENDETTSSGEPGEDFTTAGEESDPLEMTTESPFVKFISNEEMKAMSGVRNSLDDLNMGLNMLPTDFDLGLQGIDEGNAQNIDYSFLPV